MRGPAVHTLCFSGILQLPSYLPTTILVIVANNILHGSSTAGRRPLRHACTCTVRTSSGSISVSNMRRASKASRHLLSVQDFLRSVYRVIPLCGVASGKFPLQHAMHLTLGDRKAGRLFVLYHLLHTGPVFHIRPSAAGCQINLPVSIFAHGMQDCKQTTAALMPLPRARRDV